jgi:hypothetical protein
LNTDDSQITGIFFDCKNKPTGFYRDHFFCDIFHVCVGQQQKKTYSCPQIADQFYFDDILKRCEFTEKNPSGCMSNNYFRKLTAAVSTPLSVTSTSVPLRGANQQAAAAANYDDLPAWKVYARMNDQFKCDNKQDGFYSSRWCNVFYRCNNGYRYEFLCARQHNGERLWWMQHSEQSQQAPDQDQAYCAFPCDINRECTSPGGILIDTNETISESTSEVKRILNDCNPTNNYNIYKNNPYQTTNNNKLNIEPITSKSAFTTGLPVYQHKTSGDESAEDIFRLPNNDNPCYGIQGTVFQEDSQYCNVFHVCYNGVRKDFLCAKASHNQYELWWNSITSTCDWPCKVKCYNKKIYASNNTPYEIQAFDFRLNGVEDCVGRMRQTARSTNNSSFLNLIGNLG